MTTKIENLNKDIQEIKRELYLIKHILAEDYELIDYAKKALKQAKKTPKSKFISHEVLKKNLLR